VKVSVSGEQRRGQVLAAALAADPTLTVAQVQTALAAVAEHPAPLRSLAAALSADPRALAIGAPPMVGRLVVALRAQGASWLAAPSCARCRREGQRLTPILSNRWGLHPLSTPRARRNMRALRDRQACRGSR
jgi:hypothetical protein